MGSAGSCCSSWRASPFSAACSSCRSTRSCRRAARPRNARASSPRTTSSTRCFMVALVAVALVLQAQALHDSRRGRHARLRDPRGRAHLLLAAARNGDQAVDPRRSCASLYRSRCTAPRTCRSPASAPWSSSTMSPGSTGCCSPRSCPASRSSRSTPQVARSWWIQPALKLFRAFPVDPTNPMATKAMVKAVESGQHAA